MPSHNEFRRWGAAWLLLCLIVLLPGCATAKAAEAQPHPFASLPSLAEFARTNDIRLHALETRIAKVETEQADFADKLDDLERRVMSSEKTEPVLPKMEAVEQSVALPVFGEDFAEPRPTISFGNTTMTIDEFIATWYRADSTFHDPTNGEDITEHLVGKHRVAHADQLDLETQRKLHIAIHEREAAGKPVATSSPLIALADNCPNGQCPVRSRSVEVTKPGFSRANSVTVYESTPVVTRTYSGTTYYRGYSGQRCQRSYCRQGRNGRVCRRARWW